MNDIHKTKTQLIRELAEARKRNAELDALNAIARAVSGSLDMRETLTRVAKEVRAALHGTRCSVYLVDEELGHFTRVAVSFRDKPSVTVIPRKEEELPPLNRRMLQDRIPVTTCGLDDPQFAPEERQWAEKQGVQATLGVPLVTGNRSIGYFVIVEQDRPRRFSPEEVSFCEAIASQASASIENARLHTQHKQAEEALRESQERFKELAELLPEIVFESDLEGKLTFCSQIAFERFGYTREEFNRGLNVVDMIAPEDRERGKKNIQRRLRGEDLGMNEYTMQRKDGRTFPALLRSSPILHGDRSVGLRGVIIDITDRKQAEEITRIQRDLGTMLNSTVGLKETLRVCVDAAIRASGMDCGGGVSR